MSPWGGVWGGIRGTEGRGEGGIGIYKGTANVRLRKSSRKSEATRITMGPNTMPKYIKNQRYEIRKKNNKKTPKNMCKKEQDQARIHIRPKHKK